MSATSAPFGFRPSFHNSGQMRPKAYTITTGFAANIFAGDPVKLVDAGTIQLGTTNGLRADAADDIPVLGIFAGVEYNDSLGKPTISPFWPTGTTATNIVAYVYDDPETLFDVQLTNPNYATPAPNNSVQTEVGEMFGWVYNNSTSGGSTSTGLSLASLTTASGKTMFQVTRFANNIADSLTDQYIVATVRINLHQYKAATTAV